MPLQGVQRIQLSGREWYPEWALVKAFKTRGIRMLREMLSKENVTYFALSPLQRKQIVDAGIYPNSWRNNVLVSCDDVDAYLERNAHGSTLSSENSVMNNVGEDSIKHLGENPQQLQTSEESEPNCVDGKTAESELSTISNISVKAERIDCSCVTYQNESDVFSVTENFQMPILSLALSENGPGAKRLKEEPKIEEHRFICTSCPFHNEFPTETIYNRHLTMAHSISPSSAINKQASSMSNISPEIPPVDKKVFACEACLCEFSTIRGLRLHQTLTKHSNDGQSSCQFCPLFFQLHSELDKHIEDFHTFSCIENGCDERFHEGRLLFDHVEEYHKNVIFCCKICFTTFRSNAGYRLHISKTCPGMDPKQFKLEKQIAENGEQAITNKFRCDICRKHFSFSLTLLCHKRKYHSKGNEKCDQSHQSSQNFESKFRRFSCGICGLLFAKKDSAEAHEASHATTKQYPCPLCDRTFNSTKALWKHKKSHKTLFALKCRHCPRSFNWKAKLKRHMEIFHSSQPNDDNSDESSNSGAKNISSNTCNVCLRTFATTLAMHTHRRCHSFERKAKQAKDPKKETTCEICGKSFKDPHMHKEHMDRHAGRRSHQCDKCGKSFVYKTAYLAHRRMSCNRTELRFRCGFCQDLFTSQRSLNMHISRIHPDRKNTCWHCLEKFFNHAKLSRHIRSQHPDDDYLKRSEEELAGLEEGQILLLPPPNEVHEVSTKAENRSVEVVSGEDDGPPPLYLY